MATQNQCGERDTCRMRGVLGAEVLPELRGVQNYLQGKVLTRTKPEGRDTARWEGSMESSRQSIGVNTRTQWIAT